jgi:phosphoenolpyruvate carboxykinase (GTP)
MFNAFESYHDFVKNCQEFLKPERIVFCDGSKHEYHDLCMQLVSRGVATKLKGKGRYYFHSDPKDVARVEKSTYICSEKKSDAGCTNNWVDPKEMIKRIGPLFKGCMKGRTMYVIFYAMGPLDSPYSRLGIEITDSEYVVINMHLMTRMSGDLRARFDRGEKFSVGVHSVGCPLEKGQEDLSWPCNEQKYIAHFPEKNCVYSFGSGYGGNALLAKKCFALRLASYQANKEGWLAEHMLIIGITNPQGVKRYFAAAFPSACGKTNLAMMESKLKGYKLECVGDDIAWMHIGDDGHLYAVNPENGFFGVAPGTSYKTNPNAMRCIENEALFTNVALTDDNDVWWEGIDSERPENIRNWKGQRVTGDTAELLSHPNARFTTNVKNCPILDENADNPKGVRIDAIIFGGRNSNIMPLVFESFDFEHGVFLGESLSSEKTAAAEGRAGEMRHDPFAMLPFCGYNMTDYFAHWMSFSKFKMPKIFHVNWFRKTQEGKYMWPGYSENMRVMRWIFERVEGKASEPKKTVLGLVPAIEDLDLQGLDIDESELKQLLEVRSKDYVEYAKDLKAFFTQFGAELDPKSQRQLDLLQERVHENCCSKG